MSRTIAFVEKALSLAFRTVVRVEDWRAKNTSVEATPNTPPTPSKTQHAREWEDPTLPSQPNTAPMIAQQPALPHPPREEPTSLPMPPEPEDAPLPENDAAGSVESLSILETGLELAEAAEHEDKPHKARARTKPRKESAVATRKGSVDRAGQDIDSPRADRLLTRFANLATQDESLLDGSLWILTEEDDIDGKKLLARALWALWFAHFFAEDEDDKALSAADMCALIYKIASIDIFPTNIARICREYERFCDAAPADGRSKRFILSEKGFNLLVRYQKIPAPKLPS